ncbi:MAG: hypothetical protein IPN45_03005 [Actinomycetales bacterium]|nr:hypothetical protein [Actinomycetales bacterium]
MDRRRLRRRHGAGVGAGSLRTAYRSACRWRTRAPPAEVWVLAPAVAAAGAKALPIGMLGAVAVDLLLDGVLVGLGVRLGTSQGIILTIALRGYRSSPSSTRGAWPRSARSCSVWHSDSPPLWERSAQPSCGGGGGGPGRGGGGYLVVEELLVEAHEERESVWLGAMFFLGFIVIYVLASFGG